jgi:hypothetical protein
MNNDKLNAYANEHGAMAAYNATLRKPLAQPMMIEHVSAFDIAEVATARTSLSRTDGMETETLGAAVDIDYETGKIEITLPMSAKSDAAGYCRTRAMQHARKDLQRHRMREKLEARRAALSKDVARALTLGTGMVFKDVTDEY